MKKKHHKLPRNFKTSKLPNIPVFFDNTFIDRVDYFFKLQQKATNYIFNNIGRYFVLSLYDRFMQAIKNVKHIWSILCFSFSLKIECYKIWLGFYLKSLLYRKICLYVPKLSEHAFRCERSRVRSPISQQNFFLRVTSGFR